MDRQSGKDQTERLYAVFQLESTSALSEKPRFTIDEAIQSMGYNAIIIYKTMSDVRITNSFHLFRLCGLPLHFNQGSVNPW